MSGEMLAFIAVMGFIFFILVFSTQYEFLLFHGLVLFEKIWTVIWTPESVMLLFILVGIVVAINVLLGVKKLYLYVFSRDSQEKARDEWNDYRIK
jgi:hypothetical protein